MDRDEIILLHAYPKVLYCSWHDADQPSLLNMHNWSTKGKVHVFSDKQINVDMDKIVSFVIQSGQVSEGGVSSVSVYPFRRLQDIWTDRQTGWFLYTTLELRLLGV